MEALEGLANMPPNFWKNKNVLITGYEGFVGSHLSRTLLGCKANVFGLDIVTHRKNTILINDFARINITQGTVEDYGLVCRIIQRNKIEFIFHLAAKAIVGEALSCPREAFSTNIEGTWNVLEACRHSPSVKAIIIASSDKAYGIQGKLPYRENSPLCGSHPYDVSKSCADLLAYTYFHTYGLPVCVTRCGNIFGPGDFNFSRIVPDCIRSVFKGRTFVIRSDGKFTRDYIYIKDIISAYLLLARRMAEPEIRGEAFNFSNEHPVSVLELVKKIFLLSGKKPNYTITNRARYEIRHQYLSAAKAKNMLGWKPEFTLREGLKETIAWYKKYYNFSR